MPKPPANQEFLRREIRIPARLLIWSRRAGQRFPSSPDRRRESKSSRVLRSALSRVQQGRVAPIRKGCAPLVSEPLARADLYADRRVIHWLEAFGADLSATVAAGLQHLSEDPDYWDPGSAAAFYRPPTEQTHMANVPIGITVSPNVSDWLEQQYGTTTSEHVLKALVLAYGTTPSTRAGVFGSRPRMPRGGRRRVSLTATLPEGWGIWLRRPGCNASATVDQALQLLQALG